MLSKVPLPKVYLRSNGAEVVVLLLVLSLEPVLLLILRRALSSTFEIGCTTHTKLDQYLVEGTPSAAQSIPGARPRQETACGQARSRHPQKCH